MEGRDCCGSLSLAATLEIVPWSQLAQPTQQNQILQSSRPLCFEGRSATVCCYSLCVGVCVSLLTGHLLQGFRPTPWGSFAEMSWGEPTRTVSSGTDRKFNHLSKKGNVLVAVSPIDSSSGLAGSRGKCVFLPFLLLLFLMPAPLSGRLCPHGARWWPSSGLYFLLL